MVICVTAHKCLCQLVFLRERDEKGIDIVTHFEFNKVMATLRTMMEQMLDCLHALVVCVTLDVAIPQGCLGMMRYILIGPARLY